MLSRVVLILAFVACLGARAQSAPSTADQIERVGRLGRLLAPLVSDGRGRLTVQMSLVKRWQELVSAIDARNWSKREQGDLFAHYEVVWKSWTERAKTVSVPQDRQASEQALRTAHGRVSDKLGQLSLESVLTQAAVAIGGGEALAGLADSAARGLRVIGFRGPRNAEERNRVAGFIDQLKARVGSLSAVRAWSDVRADVIALDGLMTRLQPGGTPLRAPLEGFLQRVVSEALDVARPADRRRAAYELVNPLYTLYLGKALTGNTRPLTDRLKQRLSWVPARFAARDCTLGFTDPETMEHPGRFNLDRGVCAGVRFATLSGGKDIAIPDPGDAAIVFVVPKDPVQVCYRLDGAPRPPGAADRFWVFDRNPETPGRLQLRLPKYGVAGFEFFQRRIRHCWVSREPVTRARIRKAFAEMVGESADTVTLKKRFGSLWNASPPRRARAGTAAEVLALDDPWMKGPFVIDEPTQAVGSDLISALFGAGQLSLVSAGKRGGERLPPPRLAGSLLGWPALAKHGFVDSELNWKGRVTASIDPSRDGRPIHTVILMVE